MSGLRQGDVIQEVNHEPVRNVTQLEAAIRKAGSNVSAARQSPGQHDVHRHIEVIGQLPARPAVRVCRSNDRENPAGTKSVPAGFFVFTGSRDRTTGVHKRYLREVLWRRRLAGGFPSPPSAKPPARRRRHEMQALLSEGHPWRRYDPSWLKVERSLGFTFTFAGSETDDPVYSSND